MKKKNILICGSYPEWMAMFYEFLLSEIDILLLEKKIYSQKGLDVKLGENIYNELISFDFKDSINYQVVFKFIHQEIVLKHDPSFDLNLCRFFNHEKSIKNRTKFIDWNEDLPNIFTKLY